MDFERILSHLYFWVIFSPSCCAVHTNGNCEAVWSSNFFVYFFYQRNNLFSIQFTQPFYTLQCSGWKWGSLKLKTTLKQKTVKFRLPMLTHSNFCSSSIAEYGMLLSSQYFWKWTNDNPIKIFGQHASHPKLLIRSKLGLG